MNMGNEYRPWLPELGPWRDAQLRVEGKVVLDFSGSLRKIGFSPPTGGLRARPISRMRPQENARGADHRRWAGHSARADREIDFALLASARRRVWITTGYFAPNQFFLTGLQLCAARGVDVRLLVSAKTDHWYTVKVGRGYYEDLLAWGVRVFEYQEGINHKKAMLLDDDWLMVGSANSDNRSMRLNFELNLLVHAPTEAARLEGAAPARI